MRINNLLPLIYNNMYNAQNRARDKRTATQTSGAYVLSSREKIRKTLGRVATTQTPPPLPLYFRGLKIH